MSLLVELLAAVGLGAITGAVAMVIWLACRRPHERCGTLELDTPEARDALLKRRSR